MGMHANKNTHNMHTENAGQLRATLRNDRHETRKERKS